MQPALRRKPNGHHKGFGRAAIQEGEGRVRRWTAHQGRDQMAFRCASRDVQQCEYAVFVQTRGVESLDELGLSVVR